MLHAAAPTSFFWASTPTIPDWSSFIKNQFGGILPAAEVSGAPELHSGDDTKQQGLYALLTPAIGLPGEQPTEATISPFPLSSLAEPYQAFTKTPASAAIIVVCFWSPTPHSWGDPFPTISGAPTVAE